MLISADDYQHMGAAGIFEGKPRVELINGEIYAMSPFTPEHNSHVDKASRFFNRVLFDKILVRTQGSIRIDDYLYYDCALDTSFACEIRIGKAGG